MNGKKPLTLDFKTFTESTGLDYAKDTYVSHPSIEEVKAELAKIVLGGNYSSTEQVNSIQQLFAYCLLTGTKVDIGEIIYSATKTTPLLEGPRKDKDSEELKPLANIEPHTNHVADPLGTDAKYQADQTQSARLSDDEDVLEAGEDMDEDTQADEEEHQSPLNKDKHEPSPAQDTQESDSDFSSPDLKKYNNILPLTERQLWEKHQESVVSYADLGAYIEGYYEENVDHREQTDKLVQATMDSLDKTATNKTNLLKALNEITKALQVIQDAVKDDPALNKKVIEATEAYTKNSTALTELLTIVKNFDLQGLKSSIEFLQATALRQKGHLASWAKSSTSMAWNLGPRMTAVEISQAEIRNEVSSLRQDTSDIKYMMTEFYQAFKVVTKEPPSHTKGETEDLEKQDMDE
ncbi:hypothetical protein Tco_0344051, partial [Tanacetum coccineum]